MPGGSDAKSRQKKRKLSHKDAALAPSPTPRRQGLHACKYCGRDVSGELKIKCVVCPAFQLCLDCFRVGAEISTHKRDHDYQVLADLSFPLYDIRWRADEEMLLLEAIDACGLGNWPAVSSRVGSKSAADCREHYVSAYIRSPDAPLPHLMDGSLVLKREEVASETRPEDATAASSEAEQLGSKVVQTAEPATADAAPDVQVGALRPSGTGDVAEVDTGAEGTLAAAQLAGELIDGALQSHEQSVQPAKKPSQGAKAGDSRQPAAQSAVPTALPLQQLSARGLPSARLPASNHATTPTTATLGAAEPGKVQGMRTFEMTGFHTRRCEFEHEYDNDCEVLISDLEILNTDSLAERAEKLKLIEVYNKRLSERERRREAVLSQGLLDIRRIQAAERRQSPGERIAAAQLRVFARFQTAAEHAKTIDGFLLEKRLRAQLQGLKDLRTAGMRTFAEAELQRSERLHREAAGDGGQKVDRSQRDLARLGQDESSIMSQAALASSLSEGSSKVKELSRLQNASGRNSTAPEVASQAVQLAMWRHRRGVQLDITGLPGTDVLSQKERELCATRRVLPCQYLAQKARLLRAAQRGAGAISKTEALPAGWKEPGCAANVFDLLCNVGWLSQQEGGHADMEEKSVPPSAAPVSPANSSMGI